MIDNTWTTSSTKYALQKTDVKFVFVFQLCETTMLQLVSKRRRAELNAMAGRIIGWLRSLARATKWSAVSSNSFLYFALSAAAYI